KPKSSNWRKTGHELEGSTQGGHFTLKGARETFSSQACVSALPMMKVTSSKAGSDSWQVACENPVYRKPHESASYLYKLESPDKLYFKEFTLVNYEEDGDPCHYTREREIYFKRGERAAEPQQVAAAAPPGVPAPPGGASATQGSAAVDAAAGPAGKALPDE